MQAAAAPGNAGRVTPALYTTINIGRDGKTAEAELRRFVEGYYAAPYDAIARIQGYHGGDAASCLERLRGFVHAGVSHIVVRFGGGDQRNRVVTLGIVPGAA